MINDFKIDGNVGRDPETKRVGDDYVCSFPIAHNHGKDFKKVMWIRISGWGDAAREIKEMGIRKGDKVIVHGRYTQSRGKDDKLYPGIVVSGADDIEIDLKRSKPDDGNIPF